MSIISMVSQRIKLARVHGSERSGFTTDTGPGSGYGGLKVFLQPSGSVRLKFGLPDRKSNPGLSRDRLGYIMDLMVQFTRAWLSVRYKFEGPQDGV